MELFLQSSLAEKDVALGLLLQPAAQEGIKKSKISIIHGKRGGERELETAGDTELERAAFQRLWPDPDSCS